MMLSSIRKHNTPVVILLIVITGTVAYYNSFRGEFLFDDWYVFKATRTFTDLAAIWNFAPKRFIPNLTFYINYLLGSANPLGYHIFNFLIHLAVAFIVYFLTKTLTRGKKPLLALFVALLFVSHPIQTQAVSYISQRYASLAALFYLLTIWLFLESYLRKNIPLRFLSLATSALAFISKENTYSLPVVLILTGYLFIPKKPGFIKSTIRVLPYFAVLGVLLFYLFYSPSTKTFSNIPMATAGNPITSQQYFFTELNVVRSYLRLLVLPINQNIDYDYPLTSNLNNIPTILSLTLILSIILITYMYRRKFPLLFYGAGFFFLTLLIESSFYPIADVINEHRLYLPSFGFFLAVSSLLDRFAGYYSNKRLIILLGVFIITLLCLITNLRNRVWQTEVNLWTDAAAKSPNKARVHYNLGVSLENIGKYNIALEEFNKTLALEPSYADAYFSMGLIYESQGYFKEALSNYIQAYRFDQTSPQIKDALNFLLPKVKLK